MRSTAAHSLKHSYSVKKLYLYIFIVALASALGCGGDEGAEAVLPSNLSLDIQLENGQLEVTATAQDANFYQFDFGVGEGFITDDDGETQYTYGQEGTYTLRVRANTTVSNFIEESQELVVDIEVPPLGGYTTPESYPGMTLIWQDEFGGADLNTDDWNYEIGTGSNGWGNNELQYYREQNTSVNDGYLIIEARKENFGGRSYTSSRLTTQDKFEFQYGRVDIRAALPYGQGIWPALWMLGENFSTVGWPFCGEIDIMEMVGGGEGRDDTVHGTLHWDNAGQYACTCEQGNSYTLSSGIFNDEFHVFSIVWDANSITWMVDDQEYKTVDITPANLSEFRNSFFFIFNVAVGGNWPGSPNDATVFPQRMLVDYVRVFQPND